MKNIKDYWKELLVLVLVVVGSIIGLRSKETIKREYENKIIKVENELKEQVKVNWQLTNTNLELKNEIEKMSEERSEEITERKNVDGSSVKTIKILSKKERSKESQVEKNNSTNSNVDVVVNKDSKKSKSDQLTKFNEEIIKSSSGWGIGILFRPNESFGLNNGAIQLITPKLGPVRGQVQAQTKDNRKEVWVGGIYEF